ncbi:MAG: formate dehydrogenase accessory sulfurtransferase FdhD [Sumerlaeia bacterium]
MLEKAPATRFRLGRPEAVIDRLTMEAALELAVNGEPFTVTMRTPGDERLLARGLLHTEGVVSDPRATIAWREELYDGTRIVRRIDATVPPGALVLDFAGKRALLSTSSCGICGKLDIAATGLEGCPVKLTHGDRLDVARVPEMMRRLRAEQEAFEFTGGSHAAALFTPGGEFLALFEDIGRHNAVDKAVGWMIERRVAPRARVLAVSGRVSYEIVAKAYRAQIPFLLAVSAPSGLAVQMAKQFGITLLAFCRDDRATAYSHPEHLISEGLSVTP